MQGFMLIKKTSFSFYRTLTGNDGKFFEQEVAKSIARLLKVIQGDVESSPNDLKKKALQLLGTCIFDIEIVR